MIVKWAIGVVIGEVTGDVIGPVNGDVSALTLLTLKSMEITKTKRITRTGNFLNMRIIKAFFAELRQALQ